MTSTIDLTDAVHVAVFAALSAGGVTLAPVFSVVPEGTLPSYIVIGDDTVDPTIGGKATIVERHELRVVTVLAGASKRALLAAMRQVRTALDGQPIAATGAVLSNPVLLSADDRVDPQSGALVGEQSFLIFAQPQFQ